MTISLVDNAGLTGPDTMEDSHTLIFILSYIAMIPPANLIGFAGQELTRKLPHVSGVLTEITLVPS